MFKKLKVLFLIPALSIASFFAFNYQAFAGTGIGSNPTSFFVDSFYDVSHRQFIVASLVYEGNKAQFYVDNTYLNTLGGLAERDLINNIQKLSNTFDKQIYNSLTHTFGLEWTPGIDNNPKLTVLFSRLDTGVGGYFKAENEVSHFQFLTSNEREIVYLNVDFLKEENRIGGFLAHEFQHVINYNQKNRLMGTSDALWFNEMMSEIAPTIAGLDDVYENSNLQNRVEQFLENPSDRLTVWDNKVDDYASVNLFAHYLYEQYGADFFVKLSSKNASNGEEAINAVFLELGKVERFGDVFTNWIITTLVNDCSVEPINIYCYKNSNLSSKNLKLRFNTGLGSGTSLSSNDDIFSWQGQWFKYSRNIESTKPNDHVLVFDYFVPKSANFKLPYVIYKTGDKPKVFFAGFNDDGSGKFAIENFGFSVNELIIMPINQSESSFSSVFKSTAQLLTQVPNDITTNQNVVQSQQQNTQTIINLNIKEGSLIRAQGDTKVYIIKEGYKRWIQTSEIFNMYGHLRWENIVEVSQFDLNKYVISSVIRFAKDPRVYKVNSDNIKQWIKTEQEFTNLGYNFGMVYEVNEREFNFYK